MKAALRAAVLALCASAALAHAQPAPAASKAAVALPLVRGEVIEVDAGQRRLTVSHERIPNLGMDAMTMEFLVPAGEPLPALKPHDRIRFAARWEHGEYLITRIQLVKRKPAARR
jgi:Cu(I)/Ag(I) efflux system periplasmic protein CusF